MARFVSPLVHGLAFLPSLALTLWATSLLTSRVFLRPDFYEWAMWTFIVAVPGLVIGGLLFAGISRLTLSLERLSPPTTLDHLRRCAFLYALFAALVLWIAVSYSPTGSNYAFAFQVQVLSVLCSAVAVDALVLFSKNRSTVDSVKSTSNAGGET